MVTDSFYSLSPEYPAARRSQIGFGASAAFWSEAEITLSGAEGMIGHCQKQCPA